MASRKLNDVRKYLTHVTADVALVPEVRVVRQVVDLQLLKYALKANFQHESEIEGHIDTCINGFIWLYVNGGTHDTLPDCINEDAEIKEYYDMFCDAWSKLQEYMRTNMHLMDM